MNSLVLLAHLWCSQGWHCITGRHLDDFLCHTSSLVDYDREGVQTTEGLCRPGPFSGCFSGSTADIWSWWPHMGPLSQISHLLCWLRLYWAANSSKAFTLTPGSGSTSYRRFLPWGNQRKPGRPFYTLSTWDIVLCLSLIVPHPIEEVVLFFKCSPAQDLPVLCNCHISSEEKSRK